MSAEERPEAAGEPESGEDGVAGREGLREQIDAAIRPTMLIGLQGAELDGPGGRQRIGEWAGWIAETVAALVQPEPGELLDQIAQVEAERAQMATEERRRYEAADAPMLRIQLAVMCTRAIKAERAVNLLAGSHRRAEEAGATEQAAKKQLAEIRGLLGQWAPGLMALRPVLFRKLDALLQLSQPEEGQ